jgi:hypothetical protein
MQGTPVASPTSQPAVESALMTPGDFSGDYEWMAEGGPDPVKRFSRNPPPDEEVLKVLTGIYSERDYHIDFQHRVLRFAGNAPRPQVHRPEEWIRTQPESWLPEVGTYGQAMQAMCVKSKGDPRSQSIPFVCEIDIAYPHTISNLVVWAPTSLEGEPLDQIMKDLLTKIDQRMLALEQ